MVDFQCGDLSRVFLVARRILHVSRSQVNAAYFDPESRQIRPCSKRAAWG
jgi:hypothetical protein